jgi:hypothetical protein
MAGVFPDFAAGLKLFLRNKVRLRRLYDLDR